MNAKEKMRLQFEAWHASAVVGDPPHDKYNNGDYRNQHVQRYWVGWQASREAVVVELESHYCYDRPGDAYAVIQDCKEAIEAQGLKVAG